MSKPSSRSLQPHFSNPVRRIAEAMESLRLQNGLTRRQLALAAGVHPTQMSQILLGHQGMSIERASDILGVLGAGLVVSPIDDRTPLHIGHVDEQGRVYPTTDLSFPCVIACHAGFETLQAGDELHVQSCTEFQIDRLLLVVLHEGLALLRGVELGGMKFLRNANGDDLRFVPARHRVVGVVHGAFRRM